MHGASDFPGRIHIVSSGMHEDDPFRIILLLGLVILVPIAAYHRVRSQLTGEKLDRRQEGLFILLTLRPLGLAMMAGLIAFVVSPASMAWSSVPLPIWMRWTGVALGVVAGVLLTWTLRSLGKNLTDTVVTRREHTLVTAGPYAWIRHPFYSSVGLAVVANSLAAANWFLFITGGLVFTLLVIRCAREEENLISRFGDRYRSYMDRTGRFFPRIRAG
jgi:protein-S-isoprenylcysteine O-methyltransferase Ste14